MEEHIKKIIAGAQCSHGHHEQDQIQIEYDLPEREFEMHALSIKESIRNGSLAYGALSRRAIAHGKLSPMAFYLKLREIQPAPYMYYMKLPSCSIAGSSPETHLKISSGLMMMKPSSGLVVLPQSRKERAAVKRDMLRSGDERLLHQAMVDTARDALSATAVDGTLSVRQYMSAEECHGMMRIVSRVNALLDEETGISAAFRETFPSCNVTGYPAKPALKFLESRGRGFSGEEGGIAGYFGFNRSCDTCLLSGGALFRKGNASVKVYSAVTATAAVEESFAAANSSLAPALACLGHGGHF